LAHLGRMGNLLAGVINYRRIGDNDTGNIKNKLENKSYKM